MRTDQLIRALAADLETTRPVEKVLLLAILASAVTVGLVFLVLVGPRSDPGAVLRDTNVLIKQLFPVLLSVGSFGAVIRLARPAARVRGWSAVLAAVPLILLAAAATELMLQPEQNW